MHTNAANFDVDTRSWTNYI